MKLLVVCCLIVFSITSTLVGCGCPSSSPDDTIRISKKIEAKEGGTITDATGRVSMDIPAGAFSEDTHITIDEVEESEWPEVIRDLEPEGEVLRLEPDGLELNKPITITVKLDADMLPDKESEEGIPTYILVSVGEDGGQEYLDGAETHIFADGSIEVKAKLSHFSWIIRKKAFLQARLWKIEEEMEVEQNFSVEGQLRNLATKDTEWNITADADLQTAGAISIPEYNDINKLVSTSNQASKTGMSLKPRDIDNFSWTCRGMEPGTGVFTMIVRAEEKNPNYEETLTYRIVLEDTVKVVPRTYTVVESSGDRISGVITYHWKLAGSRKPPADNLYCWIEPVTLPPDFLESYDTGEAVRSTVGTIDQQGRDLIVPFDDDGNVRFGLETQIPGTYAFQIKKIVSGDYSDDESYEGDGDLLEVTVPEPSEVSNLKREWEPNSGCQRGYDDKCLTVKWHMYDDESEIVPLSELGFTFPGLTAPDGRKYPGLFLLKVEKTMVEGHPYLPYQYEGTRTIYHWADRLSFCGEFGSGQTKCGYGDDGILYFTVNMSPWEIRTISILDVADGFIDYKGTGDPIMITYPNENEDVIVTYPD